MAIPDTKNLTPLLVTQEPAWELKVTFPQVMASDVQTARSGLEQRQGLTSRSRFKLTYQAILSADQRRARMKRMLVEIAYPLQVPMWPKAALLLTASTGDTLTMNRNASADFYRPGDLVYLRAGPDAQFREIATAAGPVLTLVPLDGAIVFPIGSRIYPARLCVRDGGLGDFREMSEATHVEKLSFTFL